MAENLPDVKIGETVEILDGVFVGCYGEFKGWYYKYKHGWRCKVDISDLEDVEFLPEQIF